MGHGHFTRTSLVHVESLDFLGSLEVFESLGIPRIRIPSHIPSVTWRRVLRTPPLPPGGVPQVMIPEVRGNLSHDYF